MAEKRKLQGDIERVLKKVSEGRTTFEETLEKFDTATNNSQKEKHETELKKEIKKLQRLRDSIKTWLASTDIKDKSQLIEARKLIENDMERFKVIEKETKTKAYSKEGLFTETKKDPLQKEKEDQLEWLKMHISTLQKKTEQYDYEMININAAKRKRNVDKEKLQDYTQKVGMYRGHVGKLELLMRLLDNDKIELEKVRDFKDGYFDQFICNPESEEFKHDQGMFIYDDLSLDELSADLLIAAELEKLELEGRNAIAAVATPLVGGATSLNVPVEVIVEKKEVVEEVVLPISIVVPAIVEEPSHQPRKKSKQQQQRQQNHDTSEVQQQPTSVQHHQIKIPVKQEPTPTQPQPQTQPVLTEQQQPAQSTQQQKSIQQPIQQQIPPTQKQQQLQHSPQPHVSQHQYSSQAISEPSLDPPIIVTSQPLKSVISPTLETVTNIEPSPARESLPPSTVVPPATDAFPVTVTSTADPVMLQSLAPEHLQINSGFLLPFSQLLPPMPTTRSVPVVPMPVIVTPNAIAPTFDLFLDPGDAMSPFRSPNFRSSDIHSSQLVAMEIGLQKHAQIQSTDCEKARMIMLKNEVPVPESFKVKPIDIDEEEYYSRLDSDTLFFIFYYFEGSRAQFLAARALKRMSWRFHTGHLSWFQRHEEPKNITENSESGTYIYYDYETMTQKKKENFTFSYNYLEDNDF